ncbi:hypothetical protein SLS56_004128 [Neofusicoccum ribis]|uniref:Uncharacterized protein n=1 Tax=Neofusicoccum ribis TaxID=45134 RepID=A0ABR3SY06_9PEZI
MACPIHGSSDFTLPRRGSEYYSGFCTECFEESPEENYDYSEPLAVDEERLESTDDNTQQSIDEAYWLTSTRQYEGAAESKDHDEDGDSTVACHASDDAASTDTSAFDTPTSSSDQFGTYYVASYDSVSFSGSAFVSEDEFDTAVRLDYTHILSDWLDRSLDRDNGPWSTYNRRAESMQAPTPSYYRYISELNDDAGDDSATAPSYSG